MAHGKSQTRRAVPLQLGDAAVDGLIDGPLAGLAMALWLVLIDALSGGTLLAVLTGFDLEQWSSPWRGLLLHLTLAAIYGAVFCVARRAILRQRSINRWVSGVIGLGYGLLLWLIAPVVLSAGVAALLRAITPFEFFIAHVIYGISLGLLSSRR